jgi:hypothetical protein
MQFKTVSAEHVWVFWCWLSIMTFRRALLASIRILILTDEDVLFGSWCCCQLLCCLHWFAVLCNPFQNSCSLGLVSSTDDATPVPTYIVDIYMRCWACQILLHSSSVQPDSFRILSSLHPKDKALSALSDMLAQFVRSRWFNMWLFKPIILSDLSLSSPTLRQELKLTNRSFMHHCAISATPQSLMLLSIHDGL